MWPKYTWYVAPVLYGGATLVGLSRMYHNKHWASDVVLGAAIGTFSGLKVVRYSHAHPDNPVDKVLLRAIDRAGRTWRSRSGLHPSGALITPAHRVGGERGSGADGWLGGRGGRS